MNFILVVGHPSVADFEGIHVVPGAWLPFVGDRCDLTNDIHYRAVKAGQSAIIGCTWASIVRPVKRIIDVAAHPPRIGHGLAPIPGIVFSPIAHGV